MILDLRVMWQELPKQFLPKIIGQMKRDVHEGLHHRRFTYIHPKEARTL